MDIDRWTVVRSKAGRDSGALFTAVGMLDEAHVLLADGRLRKLDKPKKKKLRHVARLDGLALTELMEAEAAGTKVTDSMVRKSLARFAEALSGEIPEGTE